MKPIGVGNPDVEVKMNETEVADFNVFIKMKPTLKKMKLTEVGYPDTSVEMNDAGVADLNVEVKMPGQILVVRFYFYPVCLKNPPISRQGNALPLRFGSYLK